MLDTAKTAPQAPIRLEELGLEPTFARDLLLKTVFRMSLNTTTQMARTCGVTPPIVEELIELCRADNLVETLGNRGASSAAELRYQLTEAGRRRAADALAQSEYYGTFPVSLEAFEAQSKQQSVADAAIRRPDLEAASGHLVMPDGLLDKLGPAVNSGRSILFYGPPGNGKSVLSEAIRDALGDAIYIPRTLSAFGQTISLFDPIVHQVVAMPEVDPSGLRARPPFDPRYVLCKRPSVITGGELTLDMLDLGYNPVSRTYQAPLQLKATGGVFIVDDLGRQRESAQALMNRWIVPIEQRYDLLSLQSGQKFTVPFDTLVIFSTNFAPTELFDGAALRRIYYKIKIDRPSQSDFLKMFVMMARKAGFEPREDVIAHMLRNLYPSPQGPFAAYHAPFLMSQMGSICDYEGLPREMTVPLVERAWDNLYVDADDSAAKGTG
ncbi:ATPase [Roseobacter sp. HKCCA0434]|uniref:ATPase n=1 Tax=Roseobacter sp. HKCCA0434 TaxID=3079297 RepID=UPI002905BAEA|nr:ATPase [Roseobacter sp. HKCCA0434]